MIPRIYLNRSTSAAEIALFARKLPASAQAIDKTTHRFKDRIPRGMLIVVIDGGQITDDES